MVFFTCNHCGESLKKSAVEKHYQWKSCRGAPVFVTCVDCLKDFRAEEYVAHTKCMTEMERYSAKGYVIKPEKNKGAKKQEAWSESLQELTERPGIDNQSRQILRRIAAQTNVPRKKPKFINFLKSSMRIDPRQSEAIWNIIEQNLVDFNKRMSGNTPASSASTTPDSESKSSADSMEDHVFGGAGYTNGSTNGTNGSNETISSKWAEILAYTLAQTTLDTPVRKALKKLQKISDEPDNIDELKKKKFVKFVQQRLEVETDVAKSVWRAFDESRSALANSDTADTASTKSLKKRKHSENATVESNYPSIKDKKKRTNCCDPDAEADGDSGSGDGEDHSACDLNNSTFDWEKSISKVFKKHKSNNKLDLTFLKNKVLKKYSKENENEAAGARLSHIENKITKVIKKIDKFVVEDDIVKLREQ